MALPAASPLLFQQQFRKNTLSHFNRSTVEATIQAQEERPTLLPSFLLPGEIIYMVARKSLPFLFSCSLLLCTAGVLLLASDHSAAQYSQVPRSTQTRQQPTSTATPTPTATPTEPPWDSSVTLMAHGNPNLPEVALTFDDGPSPGYTKTILTVLSRYHVLATFFMLGVWVQRYPELAQAVVAAGHAAGDHSWGHPDLTRLSASQTNQQLASTISILQQTTGVRTHLFRPPYEAYTLQVLHIASSLQLTTILWNVDPRDWSRPGSRAIISNVLSHTHNGAVILLHDGGGNRAQTVEALPTIIKQLRARGFTFVTIPQMLAHLALTATPSPSPTPACQQVPVGATPQQTHHRFACSASGDAGLAEWVRRGRRKQQAPCA